MGAVFAVRAALAVRAVWRRLAASDDGQDLVEYAVIAAVVAIAGMAALGEIQTALSAAYTAWNTQSQDLWIMPAPGAGTP